MASVGLLAAGVAHEINNPLSAVLSNLDLASEELGQLSAPPVLVEELADARVAARRIRDIVRDLKMFSRAGDDASGAVDIHRVLDSTLRMASNEIRHRARVVRRFGPVPLVDANESKLGQVFLNLIVNAAQSIPEGHVEHNEIALSTQLGSDNRVVIEVKDTGSGMTADVMHQLFTPFFTTKPIGVGTGLGLSICHRIITGIGGEISVDSKLGQGSTFRVYLRATTRPPTPTIPEGVINTVVRRGRVLIVDDERLVANAFSRSIRNTHEVTVAYGGGEALELIHNGQRYDAILCDLMMPEMTGMDLYYAILDSVPDQLDAFIFMSGGAFTPKARAFLDVVKNPRLEKPFNQATLLALIRDRMR
jgi:CheY-like chemotaxis protein